MTLNVLQVGSSAFDAAKIDMIDISVITQNGFTPMMPLIYNAKIKDLKNGNQWLMAFAVLQNIELWTPDLGWNDDVGIKCSVGLQVIKQRMFTSTWHKPAEFCQLLIMTGWANVRISA